MTTLLAERNGAPTTPNWLMGLRSAVASSVSADDVTAIIQAQVEKAKNGDEKAAKFVLDYVMGPNGKSAQSITQNVFHVHLPSEDSSNVIDASAQQSLNLRQKIYTLLEASGPLTPGQIAANLSMDHDEVLEALDHHWFKSIRGGQYGLTKQR